MKKKCLECGHNCHCIGQGYYVSTEQCNACDCDLCCCEQLLVLTEPVKKKSIWEKFIDWWSNGI